MKGDVGTVSQNFIWSDIAQQMADEMLHCDIDEFLCHYAPFCPTSNSVNSALEKLTDERLLLDDKWRHLKGKNIPSKTPEIETKVFSKLKPIFQALTKQNCIGIDSEIPRKCSFNYHDCGDTQMVGEIVGSTFQIDAYFSPISSPPTGKVVTSQVAVAAEFKKKRKDLYDVTAQMLNINVF